MPPRQNDINKSSEKHSAALIWPSDWVVFGPVKRTDPVISIDILQTIPKELRVADHVLIGRTVECVDGSIDLSALLGGHREGMSAYAFAELNAIEDQTARVGTGADYWMQWWLDGQPVYDTLSTGNEMSPCSVGDHEFKMVLARGRHIIAVRVISGDGGFRLVSGGPEELRETIRLKQNESELPAIQLAGCQLMPGAEFYVAVDNKGLWPNLNLMPDGNIVALFYNQPSHGFGCGDIEAWVSGDDGRSWNFRSVVSDHSDKPEHVRMNHSMGLNSRRELVTLVSGYREGRRVPLLPVQVCLSRNGGITWQRHLLEDDFIPYGNIVLLPDGRLASPCYRRKNNGQNANYCHSELIFSIDNGRTWGQSCAIADRTNEVFVLCRRDGTLMAAARTDCVDSMNNTLPHGNGIILYTSNDAGRSWDAGQRVSPPGQDNAHLLELRDGRLLLSLTSRIPGLFGVVLRMSEDGGATWSFPRVLVSIPATDWQKTDCGYPSTVQLADDTIVAAYYFGTKFPRWAAHAPPWHQRYHMGVARLNPATWQKTKETQI